MYQRGDLKEGMTVRSIDGHKLGKVYAVGEAEFHIEKGLFFPKDYSVRYAEISDIRSGEIILAHGRDSLRSFSDEMPYGSGSIAQREGIGTGQIEHDAGAAWLNAGECTGHPLGCRPEEVRAEEESARARAMTEGDVPVVHDELYGEPRQLEHLGSHGKASEEDTRKLDLSGGTGPKNERGS